MSEVAEDLSQVAIVGMAGRFPGAADVDAFWENLAQGREGIAALSDDELRAAGVGDEVLAQPNYVKAKGVLAGGDLFDAGFFGYSPREAEIMDPQHRVFLECAWQALESAGCDPQAFDGRIGVFAGASLNSYLLFNLLANPRAVDSTGSYQTLIANDKDFLATRVSYKLGLKGPSMTVQTACSTSLAAVHLACQSLLNGECDLAIAGGVSVSVPLAGGYLYEQGGILSPDGHCRAFDAGAGGTVAGNGVGVVVLRRLSDAQASGDPVDAVIRGTAVNNDGSLKVGYTAPSVDGQAEVIAEALAVAGVHASTIGYVETHGTGTVMGDPIEIAALTRAFREHTEETGFCAIGSVKSNVGHLDAAAGVTALIKAVLAVKYRAIPASLHFTRPNPELALEHSPFYVNTALREWPAGAAPRRAGVSSFGIGGTNVHVILEEPPAAQAVEPDPAVASRPVRLLPLSARTPAALADTARRLADHLARQPDLDLDDVGYSLACRRRAFEYRAAVVCQEVDDAVAALRRLDPQDAAAARRPELAGIGRAPVAFLFPGQGAQYPGMAGDLYRHEPVFAAELDRCAELFASHLGEDLRTLLFPGPGPDAGSAAARRLEQTEITQPVLFMVGYALARLWDSWGVRPRAMVGHSIGEYVAACLAGVFSLEDAVRLVAARGRLVQAMPRGAMLAVFLPESQTLGWLGDDLCLAAVNSTALSVASGPVEAIDDLQRRLAAAGVACRRLHTSHAFHSPSMDGAVEPFVAEVRRVTLNPPSIPFCSNVTGTWITAEQATSPEYWGSHLRRPVRFADALDELLADPIMVLLEVGPGQTLASFAGQHARWEDGRTVVGSLRHPNEKRDDREYLLHALGALWGAGAQVDWAALHRGGRRRARRLPGYPFQRQRYWVEPDPAGRTRPAAATAAATPVDDWFYTPGWRRLPPVGRAAGGAAGGAAADGTGEPGVELLGAAWLVLGADLALGRDLAKRLEADGAPVIGVGIDTRAGGAGPRRDSERFWWLDPTRREHYTALFESVRALNPPALRVVHLWSLGCDPADRLDPAQLTRARRVGLDSLLALAQGIGDARPATTVTLDVVCRGLHGVTGEERLQPENATLLGACTVIPQEVSGVTCRTLDVTGTDPRDPHDEAVRALHSILGRGTPDRDLALRGRHWWVRDFDRVPLQAPADAVPRLRDRGVYLITGGLGGVGLALAEKIARSVDSPALGLLSRSGVPPEEDWPGWLGEQHTTTSVQQAAAAERHTVTTDRHATASLIRRLQRLRELGARVLVLQADVTDLEQVSAAVGQLRTRFGPVNGVIHAAGLPSRGLIMGKSQLDVDQVLAPKTLGTLVLDRVCQGDDYDFMLLCSSLTGLLGGPGQSDYAAANAFLDGYAQWRGGQAGPPVVSVAWDTWRGVGMAAGLASRLGGPGTDAAGERTGHPLLRLVQTDPQSRTYRTTLTTADSWIVNEHRIQGHGLVPGTAYLELVRAAVAEQAAGRVIELHDVLFMLPVIVPDGQARDLYTIIDLRDGQVRFTVQSRVDAGRWQQHASGAVSFHEPTAEPARDLAQALAECAVTEVLETEDQLKRRLKLDLVEQGSQIQFSFGPRWRCLRRIDVGERRLLVTLQLDDAFLADLDGFALHPALLDVAGVSARIHAKDVYYLPFTYRSLRFHAALTGTLYCYVQLRESADSSGETLTCDIDILDPAGALLVRVVDFSIKRINDLDGLVEQIDRAAAAPSGGTGAEGAAGLRTLHTLGEGIAEADAVAAFTRILAAPALPEQVVVAHRELAAMRHLAASITPELLAREAEEIAPLVATHPRPDLATPYVAPASDEEKEVAGIWQEVLGVDRVGVDDDFFALGGHSLAAVQIGAKIRNRFGVELDMRGFFDRPTVASTVTALAAAGSRDGRAEDVIPVQRRDRGVEHVDRLDELSDEEVEARLQELLAAELDEQGGAR